MTETTQARRFVVAANYSRGEQWLDQILGSLGNSIAGGASNIQRNIIAERGLGLPRDLALEIEATGAEN